MRFHDYLRILVRALPKHLWLSNPIPQVDSYVQDEILLHVDNTSNSTYHREAQRQRNTHKKCPARDAMQKMASPCLIQGVEAMRWNCTLLTMYPLLDPRQIVRRTCAPHSLALNPRTACCLKHAWRLCHFDIFSLPASLTTLERKWPQLKDGHSSQRWPSCWFECSGSRQSL